MEKWTAVAKRASALAEIINRTHENGREMSMLAIKQAEILQALLREAMLDKDYRSK